MNVIIDRFEGDFAVVELDGRGFSKIPKELIPKGAEEGTVLTIYVNKEETEKRKEEISRLFNDVWNNE